ncbi:MAG: glycosyltransferase family 1 protein [bacterium]
MLISINASAAFKKLRTGVEEYTYQLIKHLSELEQSKKHNFVLYTDKTDELFSSQLPNNFEIKRLKWLFPMWTQVRLATQIVFDKQDVLFIPVHILPQTHPKNSVVTIHGLEYEYYPKMYPYKHLMYLRWSAKYALKHARKIIAVSENTKKDLVELYNVNPDKIKVIYHGVDKDYLKQKNIIFEKSHKFVPYILFIGRLETKKNINGLISAFELLKRNYKVPHKLVLVGPRGYLASRHTFGFSGNDVVEFGYASEQQKWSLLKNADLFILPSFYEGFGIPILEAQTAKCPVITSDVSCMPEIAGQGALLINPNNVEQIAEMMYKVISSKELKKDLIIKGEQNLKRFSWQKNALETLNILTEIE